MDEGDYGDEQIKSKCKLINAVEQNQIKNEYKP